MRASWLAPPTAGRVSKLASWRILNSAGGFTLVELLVTIGVASIIAVSAAYGFVSLRSSAAIREATDTAVEALSRAHNEAVSNRNEQPHGVYVEENQLSVYKGSNHSVGIVEQTFNLPKQVSVTSGANTDIAFARLTGTTTAQTIALSNGTRTRTISVSASGVINVD